MMLRSTLRRVARSVARRLPWLRAVSGRFGLGRALAPAGSHEILMLDGDIKFELDLSVPIFRFMYFNYDAANQPEPTLIGALMNRTRVFVDVGALIGEIGLIGAKYAARAYLFEPNPRSFARLQRNLALNPSLAVRITARPIAIAESAGMRTLFAPEASPGISSFHAMAKQVDSNEVQTETLDSAIPAADVVGFLKIDVEGAELDVLAGAERVITHDRPWVHIELVENNQKAFGRTCDDIVAWMDARGFDGFEINGDRRMPRLSPVAARSRGPADIANVLFAPRERLAELDRWRT